MSPLFIRNLLLGSIAAVLLQPASAGEQCARYGSNAPFREVRGTVVATGVDWWGDRHIVVADAHSGCRVYVRIEDATCVPGKSFSGYGRLKTRKGEDFDATFRFFRSPRAAVCGEPAPV